MLSQQHKQNGVKLSTGTDTRTYTRRVTVNGQHSQLANCAWTFCNVGSPKSSLSISELYLSKTHIHQPLSTNIQQRPIHNTRKQLPHPSKPRGNLAFTGSIQHRPILKLAQFGPLPRLLFPERAFPIQLPFDGGLVVIFDLQKSQRQFGLLQHHTVCMERERERERDREGMHHKPGTERKRRDEAMRTAQRAQQPRQTCRGHDISPAAPLGTFPKPSAQSPSCCRTSAGPVQSGPFCLFRFCQNAPARSQKRSVVQT